MSDENAASGGQPAQEADPQPNETETATQEATPGASPAPRRAIKIGSQREDAAAPKAKAQLLEPGPEVAAEPPPGAEGPQEKRSFPPPRLQPKLSPELEQEIAAALGDDSLDDILSGASGPATDTLAEDSRHQGRVVSMHGDDIFVDLGARNQGVLSAKQFESVPELGAVVEVRVIGFNAEEGLYHVAIPGAAADVADWTQVEEGMIVEATVTGHNKGGLECSVSNLRGFMPVSQISLYRVEELEEFVGQKLNCVVTEANAERRNLVLSHRAVLERDRAEKKEKLLGELAVGQQREGVVSRLQPFGAFVDLGGVDGLIHVSQMSWDRVNHPSEVLTEGQQVKVKIVKIEPETGKIGLSYRDQWENPWQAAAKKYPPRTNVTGIVTKLADFGAFVKIEAGIQGLVHISELAHGRVFRVADVLSEGQEVEAQVLSVDPEAQRMSLSLKALQARPESKDKDKRLADEDVPIDSPPLPKQKPSGPLKGGTNRDSGGEQFGLKW